jgi:hypothetical protein
MKAMSREDIAFFVHAISEFTTKPVGVSLLAIAVCQSISSVTDLPPSRAGSLLQRTVFVLQKRIVSERFPTSRVGCASEIGWIGSGGRCKFSERASRPEQFIRFDA